MRCGNHALRLLRQEHRKDESMKRDYEIVRCDLGGWNVVDIRTGKAVKIAHSTRAQAERTLALLQEQAQ